MLILAINTATSRTAIALLDASSHKRQDGNSNFATSQKDVPGNASSHKRQATILAEKSWKNTNNEAEKLMPEIAGLLEEAGKAVRPDREFDFEDIKNVVVVKGPGSFTGLRIGITVANTIAYLNGCGLTALSTFEYLHRKISDKRGGVPADIPVLLFAGKGGVYLSETPESEPKLIDLPDLPEAVKKFEKVSGDISDEQKEVLKSAKLERLAKDISDEQKEKLSPVTTSGPEFIEPKKSFGEVMEEFVKERTPEDGWTPQYARAPEDASFQKDVPGNGISHKQHASKSGHAPLKLVKPLYIKPPTITKSKSCYT